MCVCVCGACVWGVRRQCVCGARGAGPVPGAGPGGGAGSRDVTSLARARRALLLFAFEETTASGIHRLPV